VILLLLLLAPTLGALAGALTLGRLPRPLAGTLAVGAMAVCFALAATAVGMLMGAVPVAGLEAAPQALIWEGWTWMQVGNLRLSFGLHLDALSAVFALVISGVGLLIHVYSLSYMAHDAGFARYFATLNLFVAAMLVLVLADNLPLLFLGWEGVGVASWLLIGFWFDEPANADAARKAFVINRIGDAAVLLGMFVLFALFGTLHFGGLHEAMSHLSQEQLYTAEGSRTALAGWMMLAALLLFVGCTGKSAQIPLFTWLPDAMAGPTPVSALIHAATMVTAGIYLVARLNGLYALVPAAGLAIAVVGTLTALLAAVIAVTQNDIKKVLAYSTVSQLGFMFAAAGAGSPFAAVLHVMTHAFFKALLFLGAGSVIHGMHEEQDIRKMGGLRQKMPRTAVTFFLGCLAIAGVPPLSGFVSKDEILWYILSQQSTVHDCGAWIHWLLWGGLVGTAALTSFYMFRLYFLVFEGSPRSDAASHAHESDATMTAPLLALAGLSAIGGLVAWPAFLGGPLPLGPFDLHHWLHEVLAPAEGMYRSRFAGKGLAWFSMAVALGTAAGGFLLARSFYAAGPGEAAAALAGRLGPLYRFSAARGWVDELYDLTVVRPYSAVAWALHRVVDDFLIGVVVVGTVGWTVQLLGGLVRQFQSGDVQRYAAFVVLGLGTIFYVWIW
jgi:NADH-quinone oxidoreductase subunit L